MENKTFTVYIEKDEDGVFISSVPSIPGCHAEGKTQKEMLKNLEQILRLCLRNTDKRDLDKTSFVGIQNLELNYA